MLHEIKFGDAKHLRARQYARLWAHRHGALTWAEYNRRKAEKKQARLERIAAEVAARAVARRATRRTKADRSAQQKAWREKNRERNRALIRAWKKRNPEKVKARKRTRCKRVLAYLLALQRGKCAICGTKLGKATHIDHIVPISRGGSNARSNLQLTHPDCNMRKLDLDPIDFARIEGRLL